MPSGCGCASSRSGSRRGWRARASADDAVPAGDGGCERLYPGIGDIAKRRAAGKAAFAETKISLTSRLSRHAYTEGMAAGIVMPPRATAGQNMRLE